MLKTAFDVGVAETEFERVRKDGSRFMASVVVTRRNDASGHPLGFLLMSNDISEKKQAEEQLRQASQYARSLIEASLDPLVTISPEGKITDVNEATVKATGVPQDKLIGTDFSDYFTEPENARRGYEQVFSKGYRHKLSAHDPPQGWKVDGRPLQRIGVPRHAREMSAASLPRPVTSRPRKRPRPKSPSSGPARSRGPESWNGWRNWRDFKS